MLRPDTFALTALLALLSGLMAFSVDMSLPALPEIARTLNATSTEVQLTVSAYFIGGAIGTIVFGPLSDRYGRRPLLLIGLVIYCVGTAVCVFAPNVEVLIGGRVLQALGPSGTGVIARAVVRDIYEGARIGRQLSLMSMVMSLFPICAPPLGGLLQTAFDWRAVFVFMLAIGALALLVTFAMLQETLRVRAEGVSVAAAARTYRSLLANHTYNAYVAIMSAAFMGLVAWIFGAPFVLQQVYDLTPLVFSVVFVIATGGFLIGAFISARVVIRYGIDRVIGAGAAICAGAGILMLVLLMIGVAPVVSLVATMTCFMIGLGGVFPQSIAGSLAPFRDRAGAASSLAEFVRQAIGAFAGVIIGGFLGASPMALAGIVAAAGVLTLVLWYATRRIRAESLLEPGGD